MHSPPLEALLRRHPVLGNDGANVARRAFFASSLSYRRILNRHTAAGSFIKLPKRLTVKYIVAVGVDKAGVAVKTGSSVGVGAAAVFFGALVATTVLCIVCVASFGPSIPVAPNTITAVSAAAAIADTESKVFFFVFFCVLTVVKSIRAPQYLQNGLPSVTFLPHLLHIMPLPHKISIYLILTYDIWQGNNFFLFF